MLMMDSAAQKWILPGSSAGIPALGITLID
jgi:hypothetical protein